MWASRSYFLIGIDKHLYRKVRVYVRDLLGDDHLLYKFLLGEVAYAQPGAMT